MGFGQRSVGQTSVVQLSGELCLGHRAKQKQLILANSWQTHISARTLPSYSGTDSTEDKECWVTLYAM